MSRPGAPIYRRSNVASRSTTRRLIAAMATVGLMIVGLTLVPGRVAATTVTARTLPTTQDAGDEQELPPDAGRIIGSPDPGPKPQQSGDRGGWAQLLTLGLVGVGVAFIMWRIVRAARRAPGSTAE